MTSKKIKFHYAWIILAATFVSTGIVAIFTTTPSVMFVHMANEFGTGITPITLIMTVNAISSVLISPYIGKLLSRMNLKRGLLVGLVFAGLSFVCMGLSPNVWVLYILGATLAVGSLMGLMQGGSLMINSWFIKQRGLAMGILGAAGGVIGMITQPIVADIIVNSGWRSAFIYVGIGAFVIGSVVLIIFVRAKPSDKGLTPLGYEEKPQIAVSQKQAVVLRGITSKEALKMPVFWLTCVLIFLMGTGLAFIAQMATFSTSLGYTTTEIGTIMSIVAMGQALGAVIVGYLSDKIGSVKTCTLTFALIGTMAILMLLSSSYYIALLGAGFICGYLITGTNVVVPLIISEHFGDKEFSQIYGYLLSVTSIPGVVITPIYSSIFDITGNYNGVMYLLLGFSLTALFLTVIWRKLLRRLRSKWNSDDIV